VEILFASLTLLIATSYFVGLGEAKRQRYFLLTTNDSLVVLRVYGDRAICVPFKSETHEITHCAAEMSPASRTSSSASVADDRTSSWVLC
jgi:hypothetical protein